MSDDAAAEERRAKAAARQAKLLAKSKERLDRIQGAVKGEGRVVSDSIGGIAPRPANTNPPPPTSLSDINNDDDPAEIDLATASPLSLLAGLGGDSAGGAAQNPFAAFGGGAGGAPGDDMFSQMMAQMMQGGGGAAGAGGAGGAGGAPPNPFMQPPTSPFAPAPKTLLDRVFPLVHILSMVGLAVYVVFVYEPAQRLSLYGWTGENGGVDWYAWGSLLSRQPKALESAVAQRIGFGTLAEVPLLWMFISVELVLQTTRLFLVRNRPAPPGILNSILPLLSQFSPQLGLALQTGVRYFDLFSTCLNDLAVLVFCIGAVVLVGRYKAGAPAPLEILTEQAASVVNKVVGEL
ncbi:uncharacterized protein RHOBADRAFT_54845 [Rhodotorula graminis WP1]|uniref:Golgi to ER traffic protein 2 n=1 Tax=Rhodotorula graminis (strain WP1) TaxID=578459 RepID=A0A0P9FD40_RHOGW|nr:uncharacterized protein RHOBADRAFT_54845 [Rhodotorula graminis WP1]KPV73648.1 hypothetical protein RHOBADRAFT_54845 [Rhodotorula graminis WP1]